MEKDEDKYFTGPFKPLNILMVGIFIWVIFMVSYPLKYLNCGFVYTCILIGGAVVFWMVWITIKDRIAAALISLLVTSFMPMLNDNILVSDSTTSCQVIGKYRWVSPNNKNRTTSMRHTYQLQCEDGIKEAGGPLFQDYSYEIGDRVKIKSGFFNFELI
jgi:hypothetical protein